MSYLPPENLQTGDGGGGKGIEGGLVFAWNRVDISQFDGSGPQFFTSGGGGPGSIAVVSVSGRGNVIRYTPPGGSSTVNEIFLVTAPIVFPDERRDLLIEIELADMTPTAGGGYGGAAFLCDDTEVNFHGFIHAGGGIGAELQRVINDGSPISDGSTGSGSTNSARFRYHIRGDKPAGGPPRITSWQDVNDSNVNTDQGRARRTGSEAAVRGNLEDFGSDTTLSATWNDLACDRFGLAIASSAGNAPPSTFDVLDFRAYVVDP